MRPGMVARVGVGAAAAAFDPLTLSPAVWYKPETLSALSDGNNVTTWPDSSGNARNATNANPSWTPLYKTAIQNGRPVVRFRGPVDWLETANFTLNQPVHVFFAGVCLGADGDQTFLDGLGLTMLVRQMSPRRINLYGGGEINGPTAVTDVWRQYACLFNGASSEVRVDGGSATTGNPGSSNPGRVTLGARGSGGGQYGQVDLGEVLIFPSVLSTTDRQAVESYLRTRWATP